MSVPMVVLWGPGVFCDAPKAIVVLRGIIPNYVQQILDLFDKYVATRHAYVSAISVSATVSVPTLVLWVYDASRCLPKATIVSLEPT